METTMSKKNKTTTSKATKQESPASTEGLFDFDEAELEAQIEEETQQATADREEATPESAAESIPDAFYQAVMGMCEVDAAANKKLAHLQKLIDGCDAMEKDRKRVLYEKKGKVFALAASTKKEIATGKTWGHYTKAVDFAGSPEMLLEALKLRPIK
jgi:hypothetical protein